MSCNYFSGSAFNGNKLNSSHPITKLKIIDRDITQYVSLTRWCKENFISKDIGRTLIKKKLLIAQRLYGKWWVCANLKCLPELLDYLGLAKLYFDAPNKLD